MNNYEMNNYKMNKTWYKSIRSEYLEMLESGKKKYEGRVNWKDWSKMNIGDTIIFTDEHGLSLAFRIVNILKAYNFDHLYDLVGSYLMPNVPQNLAYPERRGWVQKEYESLFQMSYEKINAYGVLGIYLNQI